MQRSGIGEDLEALLTGKRSVELSGMEKKLMILSYLSERPCSTSYSISTFMDISERGALWHLRSMCRKEILEEMDVGGKSRFFIIDHIRKEHCMMFSIMSERRHRGIMALIWERPGISVSELCERFGISRQGMWKTMKRLMETGLIRKVRDGKHTRYYPSKEAEELARTYAERRESAASVIERGVKRIGLDCTAISHRNGILHLRIGDDEFSFSTDPFRSIMEG